MNSAHGFSEGAEVPEDKTDNEFIAQFMGYDKVTVNYFGTSFETEWQRKHQDWMETVELDSIGDYIVNVKNNEWIHWKDVAYDTSWDWLMPVWIKFRDLDFPKGSEDFNKHGDWIYSLQWYLFSSYEPKTFAERLAYAIKWYNKRELESLKNKPI